MVKKCFLFLQLANTEEFIDGALTGNLGEVLIRLVVTVRLYSCDVMLVEVALSFPSSTRLSLE